MLFQIIAIGNIIASMMYTCMNEKVTNMFDKINKMFARFTIRKWSKGTLHGNFISYDKEKIQAEYIIHAEKAHIAEAMDAAEQKAEKEIKKTKMTVFCMVAITNVVCSLAAGYHELALILFIINSISAITNNQSISLLINAVLMSNSYVTKVGAILLTALEMFLPYIPKKFKKIINTIIIVASIQPLVTLRNDVRKQWKDFDVEMENVDKMNKINISEYWKNLGLKNKPMTAVRLSAITPDKMNKQARESMRLTDHFIGFDDVRKNSDKYGLSDLSNRHHVLSINKRILSTKKMIVLKSNDEFLHEMVEIYGDLKYYNISRKDAVIRALSTDGSAGEFAKRTLLEPAWKDQTVPEILTTWQLITDKIYNSCMFEKKLNEDITEYMLYRKNEILPYDENSEIKITRLMNSPNLAARVADTYAFWPMNEAINENRWNTPGKLGMNIATDLNLMITHEIDIVILCADFSDFDGSQHPYQMYANCHTRVKHTAQSDIDLKSKIQKISYITKRYEAHWRREVHSNDGVQLTIVGQQASGDITTSDDNTMRSATYMKMVIKLYNTMAYKKMDEDEIILICSGDDVNIVSRENNIEVDKFKTSMYQVAYYLGWSLKMVDVFKTENNNIKEAMILSHGIELNKVIINSTKFIVPLLTREKEKQWAKWDWAAEQPKQLSNKTAAKITAKMISFIVMLWSDAKMLVYCHYMLITLMSKSATTRPESYSWRKLDKIGLEVIKPNNLLSMQLGINLPQSEMLLKIHGKDYENIMEKLKILHPKNYWRLLINRKGKNWINITKLTQYTVSRIEESYIKNIKNIKGRENDIMWWRETMEIKVKSIIKDNILNKTKEKHETKIITCEHIVIHKCNKDCNNAIENKYDDVKNIEKFYHKNEGNKYYMVKYDNCVVMHNVERTNNDKTTEIICTKCKSNKNKVSELIRTIRIKRSFKI